jgi:hypothetical protein
VKNYSIKLQDEPKYVQYIPSQAENNGTIEDAVNKLYYKGCDQIFKRTEVKDTMSPNQKDPRKQKFYSPGRVEEVMSQGLDKFECARGQHSA